MKARAAGTWLKARPVRSVAVLSGGLLAAIIAAACGSPTPSSTPSPTSFPSRPPSSTPASASPSPSPEAAERWGPLAVIPAQDGADTARTEGTLRITNTCVFLAERGGDVLLLWPADRVTWDAGERTITFANFDGTDVTVGDGESVVLGGGGGSSAESGVTAEVWLTQMTWVARPADGCPLDPYWGVGDLRR
jgi:hypothetical protein